MSEIDPKAIDAAVKAMETIVEGSQSPSAYPWRIYRRETNSSAYYLLEEFSDRKERERSLIRIKARAAIEAYLEFMREQEEAASA